MLSYCIEATKMMQEAERNNGKAVFTNHYSVAQALSVFF